MFTYKKYKKIFELNKACEFSISITNIENYNGLQIKEFQIAQMLMKKIMLAITW